MDRWVLMMLVWTQLLLLLLGKNYRPERHRWKPVQTSTIKASTWIVIACDCCCYYSLLLLRLILTAALKRKIQQRLLLRCGKAADPVKSHREIEALSHWSRGRDVRRCCP